MSSENSKSGHDYFYDRLKKQHDLDDFISKSEESAVNALLEKIYDVGKKFCEIVIQKQDIRELTALLNEWKTDNYFILMINYREETSGITPLIYACSRGRVDFVDTLINTPGVDINCSDDWFRTPLFWAASDGKKEIVELLLQHSIIDIDKYTMLHPKCNNPKEENKEYCRAENIPEGMTPLGIASQKAASITKSDPEHIEIKNRYLEIVKLIRNAKSKKQENEDRFYLGTLSNVATGAVRGVASGVSGVASGVASGFSKAASYFPGWGNGGKSKRIHRKRKNKTKKGRSRKHKK